MLYEKPKSLEDRINQPLNGPGIYKVLDGLVHTSAIEVNAVRHCNLSCRACSHSSPLARKQIMDISTVKNDLCYLSNFMHCETVRVVGGEPILHPKFKDFIKTIKDSNISRSVCLVTNGLLLHLLSEEDITDIDKIEISLYPLAESVQKEILSNANNLRRLGKKVTILEYLYFRESVAREPSNDGDLVKSIYETCQIAHFWRCITVDNGRLYRCPQSMIYCEDSNFYCDSIRIVDLKDFIQLLIFLENNSPLKSCERCLGSVGKAIKHEQIKRINWKETLPETPENALDAEYLRILEIDGRYNCQCAKRNRLC